jgi:hypothetical protein
VPTVARASARSSSASAWIWLPTIDEVTNAMPSSAATMKNAVSRTTGTRAMNKYERISFVLMRQSRRRKARGPNRAAP